MHDPGRTGKRAWTHLGGGASLPAMKAPAMIAASSLLLIAGPARACMAADFQEAFIHSALPRPLPAGAIVADVEFVSADERALYGSGLRARVRRMIQSDYRGATLIVRSRTMTSCDVPFDNGVAGLLIGIPVGMEGETPIVAPVRAQRSEGFRLPNGYALPRRDGPGIRLDP